VDLSYVVLLPAIIFGGIAACFWVVALILLVRAVTFGKKGVRVQGRVAGHDEYRHRGRLMYRAIYEAPVPDGRTLQCTSGMGTSWKSPPVGTVVTLLHRPQDPKRPLAALGFAPYVLCTIFGGVATILTVSAVGFAARAPRVDVANVQPTSAPNDDPFGGHALASAMAAEYEAKVAGSIHSVGGALGTWDVVLEECRSGESLGFFGVDFYIKASDEVRLRYVHDEANGTIVKVGYPSKKGTAYRINNTDGCAVLEGTLQKTNVRSWTPKGKISHLTGHVKFDCPVEGKGHVTGEVTFSDCH
jgi:hypothetical protein